MGLKLRDVVDRALFAALVLGVCVLGVAVLARGVWREWWRRETCNDA